MQIFPFIQALCILYLSNTKHVKATKGLTLNKDSLVESVKIFKVEDDDAEGGKVTRGQEVANHSDIASNILSIIEKEKASANASNQSTANKIAIKILEHLFRGDKGDRKDGTTENPETLSPFTEQNKSTRGEVEEVGVSPKDVPSKASTQRPNTTTNMRKPTTPKIYKSSNEIIFPRRKLMQSIIQSMFKKMKLREEDMERMGILSKESHVITEKENTRETKTFPLGRGMGIHGNIARPTSTSSEEQAKEIDSDAYPDSEDTSSQILPTYSTQEIRENEINVIKGQNNSDASNSVKSVLLHPELLGRAGSKKTKTRLRKGDTDESGSDENEGKVNTVQNSTMSPKVTSTTMSSKIETLPPKRLSLSPDSTTTPLVRERSAEEGSEVLNTMANTPNVGTDSKYREGFGESDSSEEGSEDEEEEKPDEETEEKAGSDESRKSKTFSSRETDLLIRYQQSITEDQEHYYRGPGNVCYTKEKIKERKAQLKAEGKFDLITKHEIERKRCWWFTRTMCASVDGPEPGQKETRCICKKGYTWEGGACMAYHEQPCRWSADCVVNARCNISSDAFHLDFLLEKEDSAETTNEVNLTGPVDVNESRVTGKNDGAENAEAQETEEGENVEGEQTKRQVTVDSKSGPSEEDADAQQFDSGDTDVLSTRYGTETEREEIPSGVGTEKSDLKLLRKLVQSRRFTESPSFMAEHKELQDRLTEIQNTRIKPVKSTKRRLGISKKSNTFDKGFCVCHPFLKCLRTVYLPPFVNEEEQEEENIGEKISPSFQNLLASIVICYSYLTPPLDFAHTYKLFIIVCSCYFLG